jgi:hypothetical protein
MKQLSKGPLAADEEFEAESQRPKLVVLVNYFTRGADGVDAMA